MMSEHTSGPGPDSVRQEADTAWAGAYDAQVLADEARLLVPTYSRQAVVFRRGEGVYLFDADGRKYLDMAAGIAVLALGHSDPAWAAAVAQQAATLTHVSNLFHTAPQVALAARLVQCSFADRVFFSNSGTEANEAALKFARKYGRQAGGADKTEVVAFEGGFHGRTLGSLSITAKAAYRQPFEPLPAGVRFLPFNDLAAARAGIGHRTCAVFVEPVQGEGGVRPAETAFLQGLRSFCDEHGALLVCDEVQCGLGRTGRLWAHEHLGVRPDIMTLAKPLAGGLPIGATLVTEAVAAAMKPGDHGTTFGAGPLVCRAAEVVFDRVAAPGFVEAVAAKGERLIAGLRAIGAPQVREVRGMGLLVGVELDMPVAPVIRSALARGLVVISAGENVLRLCPPLVITTAEIDLAVETLAAALADQDD